MNGGIMKSQGAVSKPCRLTACRTGLLALLLLATAGLQADESRVEARNEVFKDGFPRQYDSWKATEKMDFKSAHNGNQFEDMLEKDPRLVVLWAGYGFAKDYNAPRGHMYAVTDVRNTLRTGAPSGPDDGPMPNACWSCKSPDVARLIDEQGKDEYFAGKWASKGAEIVNPIGCADCHDTNSDDMKLAISRPYLEDGLAALGYDHANASQQDMKSLVCAQCHVEYYFAGPNKEVVFPWAEGTKAEEMEQYFDHRAFSDWTHAISRAPMLKAQHPGWETWQEGVHGKNNVSCVDCHMPKKRDKGVTFTDHRVMSPLANIEGTCQSCHTQSKEYLIGMVTSYQEKIGEMKIRAEDLLVKAHIEAGAAWKAGAGEQEMQKALTLIRHAQWRWDYAIASHGASFHAPEESLRVLGTAVEKAGEARLEIARVLAKHGMTDPVIMPDLSTKEKAQTYIGLNVEKLKADKENFKENVLPTWDEEARKKGNLM